MATELKSYRIFLASPGGLPDERQCFKASINRYNEVDAVERQVHFQPIGWEMTLGGVGRPQEIINEEIRNCDYFVLILWDRWGSLPDSPDKTRFTSGTEEEYYVTLDCFHSKEFPLRQIIVFFKSVELRQLSDPGEQLRKVIDFKRKLEEERFLLYNSFDTLESFQNILQKHLARWVRDDEKKGKIIHPTWFIR